MSPSSVVVGSGHHAFTTTSTTTSTRVNTVEPQITRPHHPQTQQLTVETLEQPLPQQHHHATHTHTTIGSALSMTATTLEGGGGGHPMHPVSMTTEMNHINNNGEASPAAVATSGLPTENQLVLLCLDYLRDLRRAYPAEDLEEVEGLQADYLTLAVYALSRCFTRPSSLVGPNNDCMMDPLKQLPLLVSSPRFHNSSNNSHNNNKAGGSHYLGGGAAAADHSAGSAPTTTAAGALVIPSLAEMNHEILYAENPHCSEDDGDDEDGDREGDEKKEDSDQENDNNNHNDSDPYTWYDYDDMHPSNVHRFYPLSGLASGPSLKGPLTLGEIAAAGLAGLGARSRLEAEKDMIQSPLFDQFVQAVKSKGFFMDPDNDTPLSDPEEERRRLIRQQANYDERYRKVVAKFRTKLAIKADSPSGKPGGGGAVTPGGIASVGSSGGGLMSPMRAANWLALTSADRQRRRREQAIEQARWRKAGGTPNTPDRRGERGDREYSSGSGVSGGIGGASPRMSPRVLSATTPDRLAGDHNRNDFIISPRGSQVDNHPIDLEQAERAKAEGNVYMQKKMYSQAVLSYTQALKISPNGPHSHVYFSNRAAALLSMKKFSEAILDSERSLALKPDYGKAHARLGLAHFLSGNYRQAMEAYTVSLKYDPNNASSKSYLEKAAKRLAEGGSQQGPIQSSFSLVSEWETSQRQQQQQQQQPLPSPHLPPHQQQLTSTPSNHSDAFDEKPKHDPLRDAEKYKAKGNAFMAHREYSLALDAYTKAIQCSSNGPQSHVYYSNRAAALCYLERYRDAISDSEKSLELSPSYGKAHARLGLSRFFLQDYAGAVAAYTAALQHDPDNAASKSYLAKARAKLEGRNSRSSSRNSSPAPSHRRHASGLSSS